MFLRSYWIPIITILFLGLITSACGPAIGASANAPTVQVVPAKRASTAVGLSYSGSMTAKQQASIVPKVTGRVTNLLVDLGSEVKEGDVLLELDKDSGTAQVAQAEAALAAAQAKLDGMLAGPRTEQVAQAKASLDLASQKLATLQNGPRAETVAQADANLKSAQAKLDALKAGPTKDQLDAAEAQVRLAKNQLYATQAQADAQIGSGRSIYTKEMKEAQSGTAYEQVKVAEAQLAQLKAGPTAEQLAQAQAAVDAAQQQLSVAQAPYTEQDINQAEDGVRVAEQQLKLAQNPFTAQDIDGARAQVAQAQAAVNLVKVQLAETTVRAPFDGVVSQRSVSVGSMAGPTQPMLTLLSRETEVAINVDESALASLKQGLQAVVTAGAYPGTEFKAKVTVIAPSVDPKSRTALVRLTPDDPDWKLRDGMLVTARIGADDQEGALHVPSGSILREGDDTVVYVVNAGKVTRRVVQAGGTDGGEIAITAGLSEGDRVVVNPAGLKDGQIVVVQ